MKFLLDEHISPKVADILKGKGVDVISLPAELHGTPDHEVLIWAALQNRCIVTANITDFSALSEVFFKEGQRHTGVLCIQGSIPARRFDLVADAIAEFAGLHPNEIYEYLFDFVSAKHSSGLHPGN